MDKQLQFVVPKNKINKLFLSLTISCLTLQLNDAIDKCFSVTRDMKKQVSTSQSSLAYVNWRLLLLLLLLLWYQNANDDSKSDCDLMIIIIKGWEFEGKNWWL